MMNVTDAFHSTHRVLLAATSTVPGAEPSCGQGFQAATEHLGNLSLPYPRHQATYHSL
jgi:hypothetical protein